MARASSESLLWQLTKKKAFFYVLLFCDSIVRILGKLRRRTLVYYQIFFSSTLLIWFSNTVSSNSDKKLCFSMIRWPSALLPFEFKIMYTCVRQTVCLCPSNRSLSCWMTRGVKQNVKSCLRTERKVLTHHNTQRPTAVFQPGTAFSFISFCFHVS